MTQEKHSKKRFHVVFDFDGVFNPYTKGWQGHWEIESPAVPGSIDLLKEMLERVTEVSIFSSRADRDSGRDAIKRWFIQEGLTRCELDQLKFPREKPKANLFIDDRAFGFRGVFPTADQILGFQPWTKKKLVVKTLLLMVGLPRAGKSTLANKISRLTGAPIICGDDFRVAEYGEEWAAQLAAKPVSLAQSNPEGEKRVWDAIRLSAQALMRRHSLVIIDATSYKPSRRAEWWDVPKHPWHRIAAAEVWTDKEICLARAGGNPGLLGAIERMSQSAAPVDELKENIVRWDSISHEFLR